MGLFNFGKKKSQENPATTKKSGIYREDSWSIGETKVDGLPIIIRARTSLPSVPDRQIYENLVLISWAYQSDQSGMPPKDVNLQTQHLEDALEVALEAKGIGIQAACITGKGSKEWRYYTYDKDEFMSKLNSGLAGHPVYPLDIKFFVDPDWNALAELAPGV
jgi:hypothetical protein